MGRILKVLIPSIFLSLLFIVLSASFSKSFAATYNISGTVNTIPTAPIQGATVSVIDTNTNNTVGTAVTDSSGNYNVSVGGGAYNIEVTPPSGSGYSSAIAPNYTISSDKVINFYLVSGNLLVLSGHVYDSLGNPLKNQTVTLGGTSTTTDLTGFYSVQVTAGTYLFSVTSSNSDPALNIPQNYYLQNRNFTITQSTVLDITVPVQRVDLHVQDNVGHSISGVTFKASVVGGQPTENLSIGEGVIAEGMSTYPGGSVATDSSGNVTLWLFNNYGPSNPYILNVTPPSGSQYLSSNTNVYVQGDTQQTITLQQPVTLSGHIYDSLGNPVKNQTVTLGGTSTTTDLTGFYSVQTSPGTNFFSVTSSNSDPSLNVPQNYYLQNRNFTINQNTVLDINLPLQKVDLHVQDAGGQSISGVTFKASVVGGQPTENLPIGGGINAEGMSTYPSGSVTTDSSGNVTLWLFNNYGPSNPYTLSAVPPTGSSYQSSNTNIYVQGNTQQTIILQQPVTFSGHVYDILGNPLKNQTVTLGSSSTTTDGTGFYSLNVSTGTYQLNINSSNSDPSLNIPQNYYLQQSNFTLTQSTVLDFTVPVQKVDMHVQDAMGNPISGVTFKASVVGAQPTENLQIGEGVIAEGMSTYPTGSSGTDSSGNVTLWLFKSPDQANPYTLIATPPSGSIFNQFTLNNLVITSDQSEVISLQYNHATPITTATLATQNSDGTYSDPTTVTLSATAASGYTVANTYYTIDGGSQQVYSSPFTVSGNGSHTITFWSVDNSGVQEAPNTKTFTIEDTYTLSGTVYVDTNQNGFQDPGESGYANATVTLNTGQTVTTDANGNYSILGLPAGTYVEALTLPDGYEATTTNPATVALSSNTTENFGIVSLPPTPTPTLTETPTPIPTATPTPLPTATPTPTSTPTPIPTDTPTPTPTNTPTPTATPTPIPTYIISGTTFVDTNQNGVQDSGELGYSGATITLNTGQTTTTDSNGNYSFTGLLAGTYTEALTDPSGFSDTTTNPVTVPLSSDTTVNFGIAPVPTATPTPLPTATPTPTSTPTPTPTPVNTPPVVSSITAPSTPVQVNTPINVSASFTDANPNNTHTATWTWGDGSSNTICPTNSSSCALIESNGSGTVTGSHTYTAAGIYSVTLKVTDVGNTNLSGSSTYNYIVVYDPSAGWVAGSKEYVSPVGSVVGNSGVTGTATFGFQVKYQNGSMVPSGKNVSLSFPAGNINFTSTGYEWMVVNNPKAVFLADGTLNGVSGYTMLVSAIDQGTGQPNGLLRIQIRDANQNVVYDTQLNQSSFADPTTSVTKGQISVH